jgi:Subtilase family
MRRRPVFRLALLAFFVLVANASAAGVAPRNFDRGHASGSLRDLVGATGGRSADATAVKYAYLRKLDSHLQNLATARLGGRSIFAAAAREGVTMSGDSVSVDVYVNGDIAAAAAKLRALGMKVAAVSRVEPERMVEGLLPVSALTDTAALGATHAVLATFSGTDTGGTLSQGDAAHHGPQARALGPTGAGVTVGVISDSINNAGGKVAGSQASGDLPGPASVPPGSVTSLLDSASGSDEGRAMSEIIFDEAPGVRSMFFSTGALGAATKAQSINNLVSSGSKVIADDIFLLSEPFFQDGIVSQAVDAAKAAGTAYFASAGNRARQSWEGTFTPAGASNNFGGGDTVQTIGTPGSGTHVTIALQWAEPFGGATTDLAFDVYDIVGGTPSFVGTVDTDNLATGIPEEIGNFLAGSNPIGIGIRRLAGSGTPFMKYIVHGPATFNIAEHPTNSNTINPDAAAANGAFTVAASNYATPATPEVFSSRGPITRLFDAGGNPLASPEVRAKPNADAADGVSTSLPSPFNPFFGTSAATPSMAGIGVLLRSANPTMPVDELYAILKDASHTIDCTATAGVPDVDCGFGFELADGAVQQALDTTPPGVAGVVGPGAGPGGWHGAPVPVSWTLTDAESPVGVTNGCGATTVSTTRANTLTCTATSAGGTSSGSVIVKVDLSPPSGVKFTRISSKHYLPAALPSASKVGCTASDPESGVDSCVVSGFRKSLGKHRLTATATNDAGLTSTKTLTYTVDSIGALKLPRRISLGSLFRSGLPLSLKVGVGHTKVSAKLTGSASGASAARTVVLGSARKTARKPGRVRLRLKLNSAGRRLLSSGKVKKIRLTVTGKAKGKTSTIKKSFRLRH